MSKLTRRIFLFTGAAVGAGLALGVGYLSTVDTEGLTPGEGHNGAAKLNAWVEIRPDGKIRIAVPRAEMGQGIYTGIATLIAEELEIALDPATVIVEHPDELLPEYTNFVGALGKRPEDMSGPIDWAMLPIILAEIWQWTPLMFLLVLTGLMSLPQNQLRAAIVLGASPPRIFLRIVLPLLAPVMLLAVMIRAIETFKIFDPVYILTRGGPGATTETISMFMYNGAFVYFRMGYVAAAALIVLVLVTSLCAALAASAPRFRLTPCGAFLPLPCPILNR